MLWDASSSVEYTMTLELSTETSPCLGLQEVRITYRAKRGQVRSQQRSRSETRGGKPHGEDLYPLIKTYDLIRQEGSIEMGRDEMLRVY